MTVQQIRKWTVTEKNKHKESLTRSRRNIHLNNISSVTPHSLAKERTFVHISKGSDCSRCQEERCVDEELQLAAVTNESMAASASTAKQQPRCLASGREEKIDSTGEHIRPRTRSQTVWGKTDVA